MTSPVSSRSCPLGLSSTVLGGRYRVDKLVAEGGFGLVYTGHHLALDIRIAIKVLRPPAAQTDDNWDAAVAEFLREAKTIARLRHTGIAAVLDSGASQLGNSALELPWIVLEWVDGETLESYLESQPAGFAHTRAACLALLRPVLDALSHVHAAGVAHRDLKPSNIMLMRIGSALEARIVDFGIAKLMSPSEESVASGITITESTRRTFTPSYAAPEQFSGTRTGPWTDVYAIGLLLTELLTGQRAYPAAADERHAAAFLPVRPTPAAKGVDVGNWEPIVTRALAVKPDARYADARALLIALEQAQMATPQAAAQAGHAEVTRDATVPARQPAQSASTTGAVHAASSASERPAPARMSPRKFAVLALAGLAASGLVAVAIRNRTNASEERPAPTERESTSRTTSTAPGMPASMATQVGLAALPEDLRGAPAPSASTKAAIVLLGSSAHVNASATAIRTFAQVAPKPSSSAPQVAIAQPSAALPAVATASGGNGKRVLDTDDPVPARKPAP